MALTLTRLNNKMAFEAKSDDGAKIQFDCNPAIGGEGLARVDMFITGEDIVINEINTMPGFTPISMFPRMWAESGMDYPELVDYLISDALSRGTGLR